MSLVYPFHTYKSVSYLYWYLYSFISVYIYWYDIGLYLLSVTVSVWFESHTRYRYRYRFDINTRGMYRYRYRFAVYRYDYIGIGIGMAISVEPYGSGYSRDKFRVPTRPILKRKMFNFILHYTHLDGVCKIFYVGKKIVPHGPYITGKPHSILLVAGYCHSVKKFITATKMQRF